MQHHTAASLDWARRMEVEHLRDMEQHLDPTLTANNIATHGISSGLFGLGNIPDASMPSEREVKAMASRFSIEYRDNGEAGAAA